MRIKTEQLSNHMFALADVPYISHGAFRMLL